MKKFRIIGVALLTVVLLTVFVIYAVSQDKTKAKKTTETVQKTEKQIHVKGSVDCKAKHATGECTGHKPGECTEKCSGECKGECKNICAKECKLKHEKGECTGHEPGKCEKKKQ